MTKEITNKKIINEEIRILLVDDHPVLRLGLKKVLYKKYKKVMIDEAETARQAMEYAEYTAYDLAIIDISLKGMSGIALTKYLRFSHPRLPILIISMFDEEFYAQRVFDAGASGYIMKKERSEEFLSAVDRVMSGRIYINKAIADKMLLKICGPLSGRKSIPVESLSWREFEVFHLLGEGLENNQIAYELNISVSTIETYKNGMKTKLNFKDTSALKKYAIHWVAKQRI